MMNWMNRIENKGDDLTQILALRSAFRSSCDLNITQTSPKYCQVTHTPQKICVLNSKCSITNQMACGPQRNETTQQEI